ncbi:putative VP5 [Human gut gokushovirus]|nr:putative VP5 [Human gut gokushovirus]
MLRPRLYLDFRLSRRGRFGVLNRRYKSCRSSNLGRGRSYKLSSFVRILTNFIQEKVIRMLTYCRTTVTNKVRKRPRSISCTATEKRRIKHLKLRIENGKNFKDHD